MGFLFEFKENNCVFGDLGWGVVFYVLILPYKIEERFVNYLLKNVFFSFQLHMQPYLTDSLLRSRVGVVFMVFNATFDNISVISWRQFYWWRDTGVPGENHRHVANH